MRLAAVLFVPLILSAAPRPLFNGRDLSGWVNEGPRATFGVTKGELNTSGAGNVPNWLHTAAEYENFHLQFEYNLAQWAEAAVILRAPRMGRPHQAGIAIILAHDFHKEVTPWITGAVAGVLPPKKDLPPSWGVWHSLDILLDGDRLRASIDGITVQDLSLAENAELRLRLKRGYIGFPDMGYGYRLRNIQLDDLGSRLKFTDLFDGTSLKGWDLKDTGQWSVKDGSIIGANGHGILYAPGVFENFELTALVLSHNRVNSGVFLHGYPTGYRGFEIQVYSPPDSVYPTGSIYAVERSHVSADYEERWFLLQVRLEGSRCLVRIDGETVAQTDRLPAAALKPGRIGLQIHKEDSSVEFRDLRVRPL